MKKALPSLFFAGIFLSCFSFLVSAIGVEPDTENVDVSKGITHEQFPDGLSFPWLNAYTDGVDDKDDPDEKHFFRVQNISTGTTLEEGESPYKNTLEVKPGDILLTASRVHNNGNPNLKNTEAKGTKIALEGFLKTGEFFETKPEKEMTLNQSLSFGETQPNEMSDTVLLTSSTGTFFRLQSIGDVTLAPVNGDEYSTLDSEHFFTDGVLLNNKGESQGTVLGGEENMLYVFAYFRVKSADSNYQTNATGEICSEYQTNATTTSTMTVVSDTTNIITDTGSNAVYPWVKSTWAKISGVQWIAKTYLVADPVRESSFGIRKNFTVPGDVVSASLEISCDNSCTVQINNESFYFPHSVFDKEIDGSIYGGSVAITKSINTALQKGENTLSATVVNFAQASGTTSSNPTGIIYRLTIVYGPAVDGKCGSSNGGKFPLTPTTDLCAEGILNWIDSNASDGMYNWECTGLGCGSRSATCSATKATLPKPPSPKTCPSGNREIKTIDFVGGGGSTWKHEISYCNCDLSSVQVSTARVTGVNGLLPPEATGVKTLNFTSLAEGQCIREAFVSGTMSNGTPYTSYLSYCKVGGSFQIKHDVPQATSPDPSVHGTVALTCSNPPVDGKCGSSNGGTFSSQPTTNLCTSGTTSWSDSSGSDGSYNWSCAGSNGGTTASCSANRDFGNGSCKLTATDIGGGEYRLDYLINWGAFYPVDNPIIYGLISPGDILEIPKTSPTQTGSVNVKPQFSITYTLDIPGRSYVPTSSTPPKISCSIAAPIGPGRVNGQCGSSNGGLFPLPPSSDLCSVGAVSWSDNSASDGTYNWTCVGSGGGSTASCSAKKATLPKPPSPKNCISGNRDIQTIDFVGTGTNTWRHEISYCDCDLSSVQVSTARVAGVNGLLPPEVTASKTLNFLSLAEGQCIREEFVSGTFPDGNPYTSFIHYCKKDGALQIEHDVPLAISPETQVHGKIWLTCGNPPVNAQCNTQAARIYASEETQFEQPLCTQGTATPASPLFPDPGNSVSWQCLGKNGGSNTTCKASREQTHSSADFMVDKRVWNGSSWGENVVLSDGRTAYYRVAVRNTGSSSGSVSLSDVLGNSTNGGSLGLVSAESVTCPAGATCTGTLAGGNLTIANLPADAWFVIDYQRTTSANGIPSGATSTVTDTASLSSGATNTASVTILAKSVASLFTIDKQVADETRNYGENVILKNGDTAFYRIVVTNRGSGSGSVTVSDIATSGTNGGSLGKISNENILCANGPTCSGSLVSGGTVSISNLAPGASVTITYERTVSNENIPEGQGSTIVNTAVLSDSNGTSIGSNEASVTVLSECTACLSANKEVSLDGTNFQETVRAGEGDTTYFRIIIQNRGTQKASGTLNDAITSISNGGSLGAITNENILCTKATCSGSLTSDSGISIKNLPANETVTVTYQRVASRLNIPPGEESIITNTASLSSGVSDRASVIVTGIAGTPVCSNFLSIPTSVDPNAPFSLTWNAINQQSFSIESGSGSIYEEDGPQTLLTIEDGITSAETYTLTVFNEPNQTGLSVECPALTVPINTPSYDITKLVSDDGVDFTEDTITLDDGDTAYYAIVVQNTGSYRGAIGILDTPGTPTNGGRLTLDGPPIVTPPGVCSGGSIFGETQDDALVCTLLPNATVTISYTKTAHNGSIPPGETSHFVNTAKIVYANLTDTATVTVRGPQTEADLETSIFAEDYAVAPSLPNDPTTITLYANWQNLGNVEMNNSSLTVTCDADAVTNLQSEEGNADINGNTITFTNFDTSSGDDGGFTFTADLKEGFGDPEKDVFICTSHIESADFLPIAEKEIDATNNDDSLEIWVDPLSRDEQSKRVKNLRTGVSGTSVEANPGDTLRYTLRYRAGSSNVQNYVFKDDIADILEYADLTDKGGASVNSGILTWAAKTIPAYETEEVSFTVTVKDPFPKTGDFLMTNVFGETVTVHLPKITESKTVQVNSGPKTTKANARPGDILTYTLTAKNAGDTTVTGYVIEEDISDILEISNIIDLGGGSVDKTAQTISWPPVTIPAGESIEQVFQVEILPPSDDSDLLLTNIFGNTTEVDVPEVILSKEVENKTSGESGTAVQAKAGDRIVYTLTASEQAGKSDADDFVFSDNISDVMEYAEFISASDNGTFDEETATISWPSTNIPADASKSRSFTVEILPESEWPTQSDFELRNEYGNVTTVTLGQIVVDTVITKEIVHSNTDEALTEVAPGMDVRFLLTVHNAGDRTATNVIVEDDIDESKITVSANDLPVNCELVNLNDNTKQNGGPLGIRCLLGTLEPESDAVTIAYNATLLGNAEGTLKNTAEVTQDQIDKNLGNNTDSTSTPINTGGLVLTKSASPTSIRNGQRTTYTVRVKNTSPTVKTFQLTDKLSEGNNEGALVFDMSSFSSIFDPLGSGTIAGTFKNGGPVQVTNMAPGASLTITYERVGDETDIPFNQSSQFIDTVTIVESGLTATANVFVVGPTQGGGGGGGGGGSRRVVDSINLHIQKEVKNSDGKWEDADTANLAALIGNEPIQDVDYRIVVTNEGNTGAENIAVEDIFTSSTLKRTNVKSVEGAKWSAKDQTFTIASLGSGKTATIRYTATLEKLKTPSEMAEGENLAKILSANIASPSVLVKTSRATIHGVGESDAANVKTEIKDTISLTKTVDKKVVKPGEEATFRIVVHNRGKQTYQNLTLIDNFPFAFADLLGANDLRTIDKEAQTLTFTKSALKPGEIWIITIKTKAKEGVPANTRVRNAVTITSENSNLSGLYAFAEYIIATTPPPKLIQTGALSTSFILFLLGVVALGVARRKRKEEV